MNIKRNIIFSLESRKKNGVPIVENVPIRMRVIFASQRIEFTTGYRIDAAKWDTDKQRVKPGCTNKLKQSASEINTDLLRYYTEIQNIFKEFEVQGTMPTTAQVKEAFNNLHSEKREEEQQKPLTFAPMEVFGEFIKECGTQNGWSDATYEKFAAVRKHLEKFDKELTFEAGRRYTFTLTINRAAAGGEVALSPTIEDWTPGTASSEETVEVDPDLDAKVVRDIDGNEYAIVRIGTQQWTGANLRTTHYNDGTPITLLEDQEAWAQCENSEEAAYCLYDNDATNSELYGMLYNWHAANTGKLCPEAVSYTHLTLPTILLV